MRNFEGMRYAFFKRTIEKNVCNEPRWHARVPNAFINWVFDQRQPQSAVIEHQAIYEKAERNPLTQRYLESTLGKIAKPAGVGVWLAEVCRVSIPKSKICVLKGFEQYAMHEQLQTDNDVFSISGSWGNPFLLSEISEIDSVQWLFRVEDTPSAAQPFINTMNPAVIPGYPHNDLPFCDDMWFSCQCPSAQNFHLTVGEEKTLRIFSYIEFNAEYTLNVAAKIKGFYLSQYDQMTQLAIRSIW